jgi:hypothetical protein
MNLATLLFFIPTIFVFNNPSCYSFRHLIFGGYRSVLAFAGVIAWQKRES